MGGQNYFPHILIALLSEIHRKFITFWSLISRTHPKPIIYYLWKKHSYRKLLVEALKIHREPIIDGSILDETFSVSFRSELIFFREFPIIVLSSFHLTPMKTFSLADQLLLLGNHPHLNLGVLFIFFIKLSEIEGKWFVFSNDI